MDIPLKRLTLLRAGDLMPLLGIDQGEYVDAKTIEMPASARRLDNVLTIRSVEGKMRLHVVEWQGYEDKTLLWRFANYLSWLGMEYADTIISGTIIYLNRKSDQGDAIRQVVDGKTVLAWPIHCVRLWEHKAIDAINSGNIGLSVLSPLMYHADASMVETAIRQVLQGAPRKDQGDLLSILGVFAGSLLNVRQFVERIGKEQFMESEFITYLLADKLAEAEARLIREHEEKLARREAEMEAEIEQAHREAEQQRLAAEQQRLAAEQAHREAEHLAAEQERLVAERFAAEQERLVAERLAAEQERLAAEQERLATEQVRSFQFAIEDVIMVRFPTAPITIVGDVRRIKDPSRLHDLLIAAVHATDLESLTQSLQQLAA